jgi:hypothetical protein
LSAPAHDETPPPPRRDGRASGEDIVNEQDALVLNEARAADGEGVSDALAAGALVHAGAVACGVNGADQAPFVQREARKPGQRAGEHGRLVEATLAQAVFGKWHRHDARRLCQRLAPLCLEHQTRDARGRVRLALEVENARAQRTLISAAGPRRRVMFVIAAPAAHLLAPIIRHDAAARHAALPADQILRAEDARPLPARGARKPVGARLDARAADGARLREDQGQAGVRERVHFFDEVHLFPASKVCEKQEALRG